MSSTARILKVIPSLAQSPKSLAYRLAIQYTLCRRNQLGWPKLRPRAVALDMLRLTGPSIRSFTNTQVVGKKKDGGKSKGSTAPSDTSSADDPFDFSILHDAVKDAQEKFKDDLSKTRAGGRINIESIESLKVSLNKNSKENVKLGEMAQVIPKGGRALAILLGDESVWVSKLCLVPFQFRMPIFYIS